MISAVAYSASGDVVGVYNVPNQRAVNAQRPEGGEIYVVPFETVVEVPFRMEPLRAMLRAKVDAEAEAEQQKLVTPGAAQALTYLAKVQEAEALAIDPYASAPFLRAEAAALDIPLFDLAAQVVAANAAWQAASARINAARRAAKVAINGASSIPAAYSAATVNWQNLPT